MIKLNVTLRFLRNREQEELLFELMQKMTALKACGKNEVSLKKKNFDQIYDLIVYPEPQHKKEFYWENFLIKRLR